jgi:diadenosine tetraphosphatase ApaH/serine/threonine PP2A family protein phosphatase
MRLALLTDIHANREALEACLADIRAMGADRLAFLGDIVGYGADPAACTAIVSREAEQGAIVLMGNHDEAVGRQDADLNADARAAIRWTAGQLSPEARGFLAGLPLMAEVAGSLLVHANGWAPGGWGYVNGPDEAERSMVRVPQRVTFCGHTHVPALYHLSPGRPAARHAPAPGIAIPLSSASRRWLAVIGAVGQPRDGNPAACWALWDTVRQELTYRRVPYDAARASAKVRAAGLPERLAARLLTAA